MPVGTHRFCCPRSDLCVVKVYFNDFNLKPLTLMAVMGGSERGWSSNLDRTGGAGRARAATEQLKRGWSSNLERTGGTGAGPSGMGRNF